MKHLFLSQKRVFFLAGIVSLFLIVMSSPAIDEVLASSPDYLDHRVGVLTEESQEQNELDEENEEEGEEIIGDEEFLEHDRAENEREEEYDNCEGTPEACENLEESYENDPRWIVQADEDQAAHAQSIELLVDALLNRP